MIFPRVFPRIRALLLRRRLDRDLEDEIEFHLAERARRAGIEPVEACRRFGSPSAVKEAIRDMWTIRWIEVLGQDLRYAARTLRKSPAFTIVAALTLALGIGANTAIFSVVDAVILRPLPYPEPARLVELWGNVKRTKVERRGASFPDYLDWRTQSRSFEAVAAFDSGTMTLTGVDEPERIRAEVVSQPYFDLLGMRPSLGRTFLPEEDEVPQRNAVIILSDGLWKRRFGADPTVVGRTVQLDGRTWSIVGVMPPWFRGVTDQAEVWVPFRMTGTAEDFAERGNRGFAALARLKHGVSQTQAQTELDGISKRLEAAYPQTNEDRAVEVAKLDHELFGDIQKPLLVLLCAVAFVLLIACTNVANLLLARSEARQREIAMRIALGAGRARVLLQLVVESCLLACLGAGAGLLLANWGIKALMASSPIVFPSYIHPGLDTRVALFTVLISCVVGLLLGLAPAAQISSNHLYDAFKQASSHSADHRGGRRFRGALVVAEVAFAMLLLVGGGLMIRSVQQLTALHPGYDTERVLTLRVNLPRLAPPPAADAKPDPRTVVTVRDVVRRLGQIPSVESVAIATDVPLAGSNATFFTAEGQPPVTAQNVPRAYVHRVSAEFFRTMRIPMLAGRTFNESEMQGVSDAVIVTEALVRRFWPGKGPIGKRMKQGGAGSKNPWQTIVGVVNDMKYRALPNNPTNDPDIFWPVSERQRGFAILLRTSLDPASLAPAARRVLREAEPASVIYDVVTMRELASRETARSRFTGWLMGIFAASALLLAMIGIYGVMSYAVTRRTQEIGIRMALGAARGEVLGMILRNGMRLIAAGLLLGAAAAFPLTRLIDTLLYGVAPGDPIAFLAAAGALAAVALLACLLPAARATRIAPASALRNE
jgi:putative ABC transport system permease protein